MPYSTDIQVSQKKRAEVGEAGSLLQRLVLQGLPNAADQSKYTNQCRFFSEDFSRDQNHLEEAIWILIFESIIKFEKIKCVTPMQKATQLNAH